MNIHTVILAAGEGSRMLSTKAKSLQPLGGHSMLKRIYDTASKISHEISFVVGYGKESIIEEIKNFDGKNHITEQKKASSSDPFCTLTGPGARPVKSGVCPGAMPSSPSVPVA